MEHRSELKQLRPGPGHTQASNSGPGAAVRLHFKGDDLRPPHCLLNLVEVMIPESSADFLTTMLELIAMIVAAYLEHSGLNFKPLRLARKALQPSTKVLNRPVF